MEVVAVIPARLESRRLPEKVLMPIEGRPLLWHVWHRALSSNCFDAVFVATDSVRIAELVADWCGEAILTATNCTCGTERVAEAAAKLSAEFVVNIQADMPSIPMELFSQIRAECLSGRAHVTTPVYQIMNSEELWNPNRVKAVRNENAEAVYFSRHPVPFLRDHEPSCWHEHFKYWGHIGMYGISSEVLSRFPAIPPSLNERAEKLEQLRWIEAGVTVTSFETSCRVASIDAMEDLASPAKDEQL